MASFYENYTGKAKFPPIGGFETPAMVTTREGLESGGSFGVYDPAEAEAPSSSQTLSLPQTMFKYNNSLPLTSDNLPKSSRDEQWATSHLDAGQRELQEIS